MQNQLSKLVAVQLLLLKFKRNRRCWDLFLFKVADLGKQGVLQALLQADAEVGVEHKHAIQEVKGFRAGAGVLCSQVNLALVLESFEVF